MKELNYLPTEIKDLRIRKKVQKAGAILLSAGILVYSLSFTNMVQLKKHEEEIQIKANEIKALEGSVSREREKLRDLERVSSTSITNPLPLNVFLGTILKETPADIYLYEIVSGNGQMNRGSAPWQEDEELETSEKEEQTEEREESERESSYKEREARDNLTRQQNGSAPVDITIRGSAFHLQSISTLATILDKQDYITGVDVSPIENYDDKNGIQHKLFEITVTLGRR